jgi:ABC-type protease/lipase transport system fused ATPase/permease subunit
MTLLEHFKDPNFWQIFFELSAWALVGILILVAIFWVNDKIEKKSLSLTEKLNAQEQWQKRFKK